MLKIGQSSFGSKFGGQPANSRECSMRDGHEFSALETKSEVFNVIVRILSCMRLKY